MDELMEISGNGLKKITLWEGKEYTMYKDSSGYPTIGVGHLLTKSELSTGRIMIGGEEVFWTKGLNDSQILTLLDQDLDIAEDAVNNNVRVPLSQNQFDALVSFAFNVGISAFANSTLVKLLNQGLYDQVPTQLMRWTRSNGVVVQGLINRRKHEIDLWNS